MPFGDKVAATSELFRVKASTKCGGAATATAAAGVSFWRPAASLQQHAVLIGGAAHCTAVRRARRHCARRRADGGDGRLPIIFAKGLDASTATSRIHAHTNNHNLTIAIFIIIYICFAGPI